MTNIYFKILLLWTISFFTGFTIFIRSIKDVYVVHFFLGCFILGAVLGQIFGYWYVEMYYPSIDNIQETNEHLNQVLDINLNETDLESVETNEEVLKKSNRKKLQWMFLAYTIFYFFCQL